jgi:ubiquinol-cytochrome c reductase cytochrome b subunit
VGAKPAEQPYSTISLIASSYWFAYFLIILPLLGITETPGKQPKTIEEDWNSKNKKTETKESSPNGGIYEPAE